MVLSQETRIKARQDLEHQWIRNSRSRVLIFCSRSPGLIFGLFLCAGCVVDGAGRSVVGSQPDER